MTTEVQLFIQEEERIIGFNPQKNSNTATVTKIVTRDVFS